MTLFLLLPFLRIVYSSQFHFLLSVSWPVIVHNSLLFIFPLTSQYCRSCVYISWQRLILYFPFLKSSMHAIWLPYHYFIVLLLYLTCYLTCCACSCTINNNNNLNILTFVTLKTRLNFCIICPPLCNIFIDIFRTSFCFVQCPDPSYTNYASHNFMHYYGHFVILLLLFPQIHCLFPFLFLILLRCDTNRPCPSLFPSTRRSSLCWQVGGCH